MHVNRDGSSAKDMSRLVRIDTPKGGYDDVLAAMREHRGVAAVQEYGCAALWCLADNDDNKKRSPLKSLPPDGFPLKTGLIWVAIIGAIVALFMLNPGKAPQPATLKIQQVVELAEQG